MADILPFQAEHARDRLPERPTREIIADLKPLRMLGDEDAVPRGVLFAELAAKSEGPGRCHT